MANIEQKIDHTKYIIVNALNKQRVRIENFEKDKVDMQQNGG